MNKVTAVLYLLSLLVITAAGFASDKIGVIWGCALFSMLLAFAGFIWAVWDSHLKSSEDWH